MSAEEKLERSRSAARGWATRSSNGLQSILADPDVTIIQLQDAMDDFDRRLATLDHAQEAVELEISDPKNLESDILIADKFRRDVRVARVQAAQKLIDLDNAKKVCQVTNNSDNSSVTSLSTNVKLPSIELPKFCGDLLEWQSFWDRFVAMVGDTEIPDISKFSYLQSLLSGEAKSVIQGLSLTTANYSVACTLLKERFGRPERIIFAHIQALLQISMPVKSSGVKYVTSLWKLQDELLTHVRSLEAMGVKGDQYGLFMTPVILSRLPQDIRLEWSREGSGHERDLSWLLTFLQGEIERRERSDTFKDVSTGKNDGRNHAEAERKRGSPSSASALQTSSEVPKYRCGFCNKLHATENCFSVLRLSIPEREEKIRNAKLCFRCLKHGHISKGCMARCTNCKGNHNILCCLKFNIDGKSNNKSSSNQAVGLSDNGNLENICDKPVDHVGVSHSNPSVENDLRQQCSVLQTAKVIVCGERGTRVEATLIFDSGADRSYISSKLVKKIKPKWVASEHVSYSNFGSKITKDIPSNVYDITLLDFDGTGHSLTAAEVPIICAPLLRPYVPVENLKAFNNIKFADNYIDNRYLTIDLLVGMDAYWKFMIPNSCSVADELVAQKSVFGWVLSGSYRGKTFEQKGSTQMLCINNMSEQALHNFWDLEVVGISSRESHSNLSSNHILESFAKTVTFKDGRYEVALPWKSGEAKDNLINNKELAKKRLLNLTRRFMKNPQLQRDYDYVLKGYEQDGIIEEVPDSEMIGLNPIYYLPHRPVIRETSSTTKVRPVFDASAGSHNGISLNDCLNTGPSLNPDLVEVLLRFRRWAVALTGDITKAFLQIGIRKEDRDVHRFLWRVNDRTRTMRFLRVPFGNKSSPFLLNATVKHHLTKFPNTEVVGDLKDNLYVDDWLSGADTVEECYNKFEEARSILAKASMSLSKWSTNSGCLSDKLYEDLEHGMHETVKILGLKWDLNLDCFSFECFDVGMHQDLVSTKRSVLSVIARLFDPLGLVSPFIMQAKIIFQDIWRLGLDWDEILPDDLLYKFDKWIKGFKVLESFKVQRCYFPQYSWKLLNDLEIHAFGYASERGYGACIYLRHPSKDGSFKVSLIMSRGRVAPIKRITLPRLELLSALLCARLSVFVRSALYLSENVPLYCWTDSQVALSWIKGNPCKWKSFVANRVIEIQNLTSPSHWNHCPGKDNPADLISRGVYAENIISSTLWLNGPTWLSGQLSKLIPLQHSEGTLLSNEYYKESKIVACALVDQSNIISYFTKMSSFIKILHVAAWVLRFIHNCKPQSIMKSGSLSYAELEKVKEKLFYCVQREKYSNEINALTQGKPLSRSSSLLKLDPFLDNNGLLRIKGRLQFADISYENKHPIIIPTGHIAKLLVRFYHGFHKHAGVTTLMTILRGGYWIIGIRKLAKTVCRECVACRRHDSRACNQPVAPLPRLRVNCAPPFTITGLDFAGPLFCVDMPSKKLYILLFTCSVVRAIHLEMTESLSQSDCMLAIRRFTARRGLPSVFYSDNAKTFVSVSSQIQQYFGPLAPQWRFIVPYAPWWGGWWERLVRSVKLSLRKTIGVRCLTRCELETTLHEIEACLNSRPLTFVDEEPDTNNPLTPSHFLIGRTAGFQLGVVNDQDLYVSANDLKFREILRQKQLDKFWRLWVTEYITNLPPVCKGKVPKCNLKKGSVVLVKDERTPRLQWPLGIVTDLFLGKDGVLRSVNIKTSKGVICRPIQRLHDLEIYYSGDGTEDQPSKETKVNIDSQYTNSSATNIDGQSSQTVYYSKGGHKIKVPERYGI